MQTPVQDMRNHSSGAIAYEHAFEMMRHLTTISAAEQAIGQSMKGKTITKAQKLTLSSSGPGAAATA